ncbi:hypothetical protein BGZ94_004816 [Podila epigama]|nr:hypothetical protein BGZ94_004816 [Podila epigama]
MNSTRRKSKQLSTEDDSAMSLQSSKTSENKVKLKVKQPDPGNLTEHDIKKVFLAIEENDVKTLKYYLSQRYFNPDTLYETNIFEENTFTWSALHAAAYYGSIEAISLLMEYNANVELQDTWYKGRPLAWAAFGGHLEAARMLIEKYSADKRAQNEHGQVALELVYERTPEWEKMFAEASPVKANNRGLKPRRDRDRDGRSVKDIREPKYAGSIPPHVLVSAFTDLYKLILNHRDKTGRNLSEIFMALPSKDEYPEYYDVIKSPMSLQLVLGRIKAEYYKTVEDFDREFQLIFENALIFNEDGSQINKDARALLKVFNTKKKEIFIQYKLIDKSKSGGVDKSDRRTVSSLSKNGVNYQAGEFVELNDGPRTIILIERLETDSNNGQFIAGSKFLRPEQTLQVPGQMFYEKEVLKASGEWEYNFDLVDHKVYVQAHKDFVRGQVIEFDKKDVYVCENRYSETGKSAFLIKDWKRVYTVDPLPTPVRPYPAVIKLPKFEVKSILNKGMQQQQLHQQHQQQQLQQQQQQQASQRKQQQFQPNKQQPHPHVQQHHQQHPQLQQQPQQHQQQQQQQQQQPHPQFLHQQQHHMQHMPFPQQIPPQPVQGYPQHPQQFNQHPHPLQAQHPQQQSQQQMMMQRERRVSGNNVQNPALFQQQHPLLQQQQQQQQQQQMMFQQQQQQQQQQMQQQQHQQHQQILFQQQVLQQQHQPQPTPGPPQLSSPQSPNGSRAPASPGSPNRGPIHPVIAGPTQPIVPVDTSMVFDPHVGPRRGHAMLQSIAVDSEDKSFVMSLGTDTFSHSLAVQHQVQNITMIPLLAPQLSPIQPQIGISVFHNGRKLTPSGLVALPNSPTIGHHVYTIPLIAGQNMIDVWVSAQVGGLFQGGPPGGKTETQQYFIFVQRHSM